MQSFTNVLLSISQLLGMAIATKHFRVLCMLMSFGLMCALFHGASTLGASAKMHSIGAAVKKNPAPGRRQEPVVAEGLETYCGIFAFYSAARMLGKPVALRDLESTRYIDSQQGSSLAALRTAVLDHGFHAQSIRYMTLNELRSVGWPVILHVKASPEHSVYRHWVLCLGISDGRVRIIDGLNEETSVDVADLHARWDGNALVVATRPIANGLVQTERAVWAAAVCAIVYVFILIARRVESALNGFRRWVDSRANTSIRAVADIVCLFGFVHVIMWSWTLFDDSVRFDSAEGIRGVQFAQIDNWLPRISMSRLNAILTRGSVTVVDARLPADFMAGRIDGAVNIPPNLSADKSVNALGSLPKSSPIVIYCQSRDCPYSASVARKLIVSGFDNLSILDGGWNEWTARTTF